MEMEGAGGPPPYLPIRAALPRGGRPFVRSYRTLGAGALGIFRYDLGDLPGSGARDPQPLSRARFSYTLPVHARRRILSPPP